VTIRSVSRGHTASNKVFGAEELAINTHFSVHHIVDKVLPRNFLEGDSFISALIPLTGRFACLYLN